MDIRRSMTRYKDSLPKEFMDHPLQKGASKGSVLKSGEGEKIKTLCYRCRGWNPTTSISTREILVQIGLGCVAQGLGS